eukprot:CFRG7876T1
MSVTKLNQEVTVNALAVKGNPLKGGQFENTTYVVNELKSGEVLVKITVTSICHTDFQAFDNDGAIPGHEMAGVVEAKSDDVENLTIGQRVAVGWLRNSCRSCEWCDSSMENMCGDLSNFQGAPAGYATHVVWNEHFISPIPDGLDDSAVAPLMCAGATVYSAFKNNNVKKGDKVAVVGIGGLGHLGVMIAEKMGCEVTALSRKMTKKDEALAFGAHSYLDTTDETAVKAAGKRFDHMLITSPADLDWDMYASMVRPLTGVMCIVGVPPSLKFTIGALPIIVSNIKVTGSLVASPQVTCEMLEFCAQHNVKPLVEEFPFTPEACFEAVHKVESGNIRFRAIMRP